MRKGLLEWLSEVEWRSLLCFSPEKTLEKGEHILSVTHFLFERNGRSMISISNPSRGKLPQ